MSASWRSSESPKNVALRCIPLHLHGTAFPFGSAFGSTRPSSSRAEAQARREPQGRRQAVVEDASGPIPGEMRENQLIVTGQFLAAIQKVVPLSKPGFPKSHASLEIMPLNHGLEAHATTRREIAHVHLAIWHRQTAWSYPHTHQFVDPSEKANASG